MNLWDDPRVVHGMTAPLKMRKERLAAGDRSLGWKVGFGAAALLERFKISGPLVGFLTHNTRVNPGGAVSFAGGTKPVAQAEVAVHMSRDLPGGGDRDAAAAAIAASRPRSSWST